MLWLPALVAALLAQTPRVDSPNAVQRFDSSRAWEHLRQLVVSGRGRPARRPSSSHAQYIKASLLRRGCRRRSGVGRENACRRRSTWSTCRRRFPGRAKNGPASTGHYDTKRVREFRFVGANDGGSSAAFLIELARVLKARKNAFTIELLFLDGEEAVVEWAGTDHTYGSQYYVDAARKAGALAVDQGEDSGRHDRRPRSADPARGTIPRRG